LIVPIEQRSPGEIGNNQLTLRVTNEDRAILSPLDLLYLAAVLFPYVGPVPFRSDVQPYAVVLATLLLVTSRELRIPRLVCLLLIPVAAAAVFVVLGDFAFYGIRAFVGYWSLFAHATAGYLVCQRIPRVVVRWLSATAVIWLLVAVAQQLVSPTLTRGFIPNVSVDADRGMSSLATEPSFYGLFCFFMLLLFRVMAYESWLFKFLLVMQIVLLARSAMGILALLILISARALTRLRPLYFFVLLAIMGALILTAHEASADVNVRAIFLLVTAFTDPTSLLTSDTSINARVDHVIYSMQGFFSSFGAPHGFDTFASYIDGLMASNPNMIWLGESPKGMRIMSGYGGALFELGWFALPIPFVLTVCIWRRFRFERREFWAYAIALNAVMFSAVQISLPLVGFLAGACLARGRDVESPLRTAKDLMPVSANGVVTDAWS
jgi:hypothetical protein